VSDNNVKVLRSFWLQLKLIKVVVVLTVVVLITIIKILPPLASKVIKGFRTRLSDKHHNASDLHLMTSRELTLGFDFLSRRHLRMAVMPLPVKFGAYVFIQTRVIELCIISRALEVMKIFLLFYVCHFAMGITHCYKTTVFLTFMIYYKLTITLYPVHA